MSDDIDSVGFQISQLDTGSTALNPIWHPINKWDVAREGFNNLFLIGQYFSETSGAIGNAHGLFHSQVVGKRNICNLIQCNPSSTITMACTGSLGMGPKYADPGCTDPSYTVCLEDAGTMF